MFTKDSFWFIFDNHKCMQYNKIIKSSFLFLDIDINFSIANSFDNNLRPALQQLGNNLATDWQQLGISLPTAWQ